MEKKNFMTLLLGALVMPMSASAQGWVFTLIGPVILVNTPFRLMGALIFALVILLEAFIVGKIVHVAYVSCVKRMLLAKIFSFLANIVIFTMAVLMNWSFLFGQNGLFSLVRKDVMVSDEQKTYIASKFTMIMVVLFIIITLVAMLLQYVVFSRLKIKRKKLITAIVCANAVTYAFLMMLLFASDYFKFTLISLQ
ncbi:MAG TPA: hypothetical protein VLG50_01730 [Candidatus Saccharimonadales bacterium]|nr:hypothetical protein [Candidatus Saccharimonadales bacterium]